MNKFGIIREFWSFLKVRKKWWITPIIFFLLALGGQRVFHAFRQSLELTNYVVASVG